MEIEGIQLIDRQCNEALRPNMEVAISSMTRMSQPIGCRTNQDFIMSSSWREVGLLFEDSQAMTEEVTNLRRLRIRLKVTGLGTHTYPIQSLTILNRLSKNPRQRV